LFAQFPCEFKNTGLEFTGVSVGSMAGGCSCISAFITSY